MNKQVIFTISLLTFASTVWSQGNTIDTQEQNNKNTIGINIGAAALEVVLEESGLQIELYFQRKLNKILFVGFEQGFIIQDNFPSNFYPIQGAPYHLSPQVDAYIRSLTFGEVASWQKTTLIYLTPVIGANLLHYKRLSFGLNTGIGITYRNFTNFSVVSITGDSNYNVVDYRDITVTNSVIAPILNVSFVLSQALTPSLSMQLNFKYNHELSDFENPKNEGSSDYMALRLGLSKTF